MRAESECSSKVGKLFLCERMLPVAAMAGERLPPKASRFLIVAVLLIIHGLIAAASDEQSYIIHASPSRRPQAFSSASQWYASVIATVSGLPLHQSRHRHGPLYTYSTVFHGFSARLTRPMLSKLLQKRGFLRAFPDSARQLHTTRTPAFLGLSPGDGGLWATSNYGRDVIVGVLDTGVWPERQSFNDSGFTAPPARWNGTCEEGPGFESWNCNNKLIGARFFCKGYEAAAGPIQDGSGEYRSPLDSEGHGTHTASTAVGNFVADVSLFGYAPGDASGMAPNARLAVYKICWEPGCYDSDILAAFESAVTDGVDVISLSVGGSVVPFYRDSIAIGSFGAAQRGVLVSCSAGNSGPYSGSVTNVPPWVLTVAASSVDRTFPAPVVLGDGAALGGVAVYGGGGEWEPGLQLPLVYGGDVAADGSSVAYLCVAGSLDPSAVAGKIVLCERGTTARVAKGLAVKAAGGAGMILANTAESGAELLADSHLLPAVAVGFREGLTVKAYIAAAGANATAAVFFNGTSIGVKPAPAMAAFSSRGPNPLPTEILKPDITAPGLNILAAYTGACGPTGLDADDRVVDFTIMSGTSMSCPHVSGLATLVRAAHPTWSPAAVKSALMTTALQTDNGGGAITDSLDCGPVTPLAYGAGHVHPEAALDPGLVYDIGTQEYVDFLCGLGYGGGPDLEVFTKGEYTCGNASVRPGDLNYPSFSVVFEGDSDGTYSFSRTLTNVGGEADVTYSVEVSPPAGVSVTVQPTSLAFQEGVDRLSYSATFALADEASHALPLQQQQHAFGSLLWSDGTHRVRSPIVITFGASFSMRAASLA